VVSLSKIPFVASLSSQALGELFQIAALQISAKSVVRQAHHERVDGRFSAAMNRAMNLLRPNRFSGLDCGGV
jgi:hypothetical protein